MKKTRNQNNHDDHDDLLQRFRRYLEVDQGLSSKTADKHLYALERYLREFGDVEPQREDALDMKEALMNEGLSHSHINGSMKALEYYFDFQDEEFETAKLPREYKIPETLSDEDVDALLEASSCKRDHAIQKLLLSTGLRASEVCALTVGDIDLDKCEVTKPAVKGGKEDTVFLSEGAAEAVEDYLDERNDPGSDEAFALSEQGGALTRTGLLQMVKRTARRADVEKNVTVHMYRRTYATRLLRNGADLVTVKELLGHDSIKSTMRYLRLTKDDLKENHAEFLDF